LLANRGDADADTRGTGGSWQAVCETEETLTLPTLAPTARRPAAETWRLVTGCCFVPGMTSVGFQENGRTFCERFLPGSLVFNQGHVECDVDHEPSRQIATTKDNSLKLWANNLGEIHFSLPRLRELPAGCSGAVSISFHPLEWTDRSLLSEIKLALLTSISLLTDAKPPTYPALWVRCCDSGEVVKRT
jgi:hypothetical protein